MIQYSKNFTPTTTCDELCVNGFLQQQQQQQPNVSIEEPIPESVVIQIESKNNSLRRSTKSLLFKSTKEIQMPHRTQFQYKIVLSLFIILLLFFIVFIQFFCINKKDLRNDLCLTPNCVKTAASLLSAIDFSINPCDDFFEFACGTWNKMHAIPEDKSSISTFEVLADQLQIILRQLLEKPIDKKDNEATIKAKIFYSSCTNTTEIRTRGDKPLRNILKQYGNWPITKETWTQTNLSLEQLLSKIHSEFNEGIIIEQWVGPDDKNSSVNIIQLDQTQLGLPSRDYFLNNNSAIELKAYQNYMIEMAVLLGANRTYAKQEAQNMINFETDLANATLPESDRQDTESIYKKLTLHQLRNEIPEINWIQLLGSQIDLDDTEPIVVYGYNFFKTITPVLKRTNKKVIFNYIIWRLLIQLSSYLIDDYENVRVEYRNKLLGVTSERSRWIQCVEWTNKKFGLAVGALFIRDYFKEDSRNTALEMIHTLREAFNELLNENTWMDSETKSLAMEKANAMNERIGYPDMITNVTELVAEYSELQIQKEQFLENLFNIFKFQSVKNSRILRKPVDKNRWSTEPAVVNAFYNPNKNDIVFPAGILQPLFYSKLFPKSLNYGGIGVVIGHEITHGFDDKGRQFDKDGNMLQWWNDATINAFRNRTQCIIDQYSRYKIDNVDLYINGKMTKGENIADNGGLKQSFRAYQKWVQKHGPELKLPGLNFTHSQLFFLNYAQIWCGTMRPKDIVTKIRSSVHCPGPIRVLGPLSNSYEFAKAYNCPQGSPMNPKRKCAVW